MRVSCPRNSLPTSAKRFAAQVRWYSTPRLGRVTPVLLAGRPGTGKTAYGQWLAQERGFVHIETDTDWRDWLPLLSGPDVNHARAAFNKACSLGPKVIIEWGFPLQYLPCVRRLRNVGFDCWWFDGDEPTARSYYLERRSGSLAALPPYELQTAAIEANWAALERFYKLHIIKTVPGGSRHMPFEMIGSLMFPAHAARAD